MTNDNYDQNYQMLAASRAVRRGKTKITEAMPRQHARWMSSLTPNAPRLHCLQPLPHELPPSFALVVAGSHIATIQGAETLETADFGLVECTPQPIPEYENTIY